MCVCACRRACKCVCVRVGVRVCACRRVRACMRAAVNLYGKGEAQLLPFKLSSFYISSAGKARYGADEGGGRQHGQEIFRNGRQIHG